MSQSTTTKQIAAHSNGVPLLHKTKSLKPPFLEKVFDTTSEGRVIEGQRLKGYKLKPWSFVHEGLTPELANQFGLTLGNPFSLTFKESVEQADGTKRRYEYRITGDIMKREKDESKIGEEDVWTWEGTADTYQFLIDGVVVDDINVATQKIISGGKDLMAEHLNNVR